jgi:hypothetical protein
MVRFFAFLLVLSGNCAVGPAEAERTPLRAYLSVFQSGEVIAAKATNGAVIRRIPVKDRDGIAAIAVSHAGDSLFVVDDSLHSRLRVFDTKTFLVLKEEHFEDRVLNFSNSKLMHLSADGHWLFLYTYSYPGNKSAIRVFDARRLELLPSEIGGLACTAPLLASAVSGSVFALCPGRIQELSPPTAGAANFTSGAGVSHQLTEISAAAATSDGRHLYIIGTADATVGWQLVQWDIGGVETARRDLAAVLGVEPSALGGYRTAWLGVSSDARMLALILDSDLWLIDRDTLRVSAHDHLPSPVLAACLFPDGDSVLTLHSAQRANEVRLGVRSLATGTHELATIRTGWNKASPAALAVGP